MPQEEDFELIKGNFLLSQVLFELAHEMLGNSAHRHFLRSAPAMFCVTRGSPRKADISCG